MKSGCLAFVLVLVVMLVAVPVVILIVSSPGQPPPGEPVDPRYDQFMQMAEDGRHTEALELGDSLFEILLEEKPGDPALMLFKEKLAATSEIAAVVGGGVRSSQTRLLEGVAGIDDLGLPSPLLEDAAGSEMLPVPAREVYWKHLRLFAAEPQFDGWLRQQTTFYDRYCDLRMRDSITQISRRVILADPSSSENVCYAVVLPLLVLHGRDDTWDRMEPFLSLFSPAVLDTLSRFALLQAERPQAAMAIARFRSTLAGGEFSPVLWASDAAEACVTVRRPDLAEALLCTVAADISSRDIVTTLRSKAAEGYARCGDYGAAARICERLLAELPDTSVYGRIVATYLGYLAREGGAEQVVAESESIVQDPRCEAYLTQILYLRWWALRRLDRQDEAVEIAQQLTAQSSSNPCVAPVLLERAIDALAHQEYRRCRELLTRLTESFPGTNSARRAQEVLARLKDSEVE